MPHVLYILLCKTSLSPGEGATSKLWEESLNWDAHVKMTLCTTQPSYPSLSNVCAEEIRKTWCFRGEVNPKIFSWDCYDSGLSRVLVGCDHYLSGWLNRCPEDHHITAHVHVLSRVVSSLIRIFVSLGLGIKWERYTFLPAKGDIGFPLPWTNNRRKFLSC